MIHPTSEKFRLIAISKDAEKFAERFRGFSPPAAPKLFVRVRSSASII
jgi:hypothetical protein